MKTIKNLDKKKEQHGFTTLILANICHSCDICSIANKNPDTAFEKMMRWHRTWCPAWNAHTKVYGLKSL